MTLFILSPSSSSILLQFSVWDWKWGGPVEKWDQQFQTRLKGLRQFGAESLRKEGGGDRAGQTDQHHDHVRDLSKKCYQHFSSDRSFDLVRETIRKSRSTHHDVDCSSSHSIGSSNTDHLRDERTEADSRLAHRGWEHLHGLFSWRIKGKQRETNKNMFSCWAVEQWEIEIRHTHKLVP